MYYQFNAHRNKKIMKTATHTTGPWKAEEHHIYGWSVYSETVKDWRGSRQYICQIGGGNKLDALLIASAPDLLKERDELKEWKSISIKIWNPVLDFFQDHGTELGMSPGDSISEFIVDHFKAKL